ncbi:MAG: hypothetical protein M1825_005768 [Sarcosagium campestre]|nr:MAG: hypothetical protein M1825_005768 [Sarcosagium campestre]
MRTKLKEVRGVDWGDGAVMNCSWTGPRLGDVLRRARVSISDRSNAHVAFACYATACQDDDWYGGSIELDRGLDDGAEVVLALKVATSSPIRPQMNGKILSASHGYPVRIVAPGIAGARCVKWLDRITVQRGESTNYYQQHDYKVLPPEATTWEEAENFWHTVPAIQDMPINSVIADPESGKTVKLAEDRTFVVRGYALPQGRDGPVVLVELSTDGGRTWSECEITDGKEGRGKWCWVLWKATVTLEKGPSQRLLSRATDKGGNTQDSCPTWNLRGVNYNGYGESSDLNVV